MKLSLPSAFPTTYSHSLGLLDCRNPLRMRQSVSNPVAQVSLSQPSAYAALFQLGPELVATLCVCGKLLIVLSLPSAFPTTQTINGDPPPIVRAVLLSDKSGGA